MRRTLSLSKETLSELTPRELGDVAGGAITPACPNLPTQFCVSLLDCLSRVFDPCITGLNACG
jgi:hypothetical protein